LAGSKEGILCPGFGTESPNKKLFIESFALELLTKGFAFGIHLRTCP